jgi:hypothetical protein
LEFFASGGAYFQLGHLAEARGDFNKAETAYKKALVRTAPRMIGAQLQEYGTS